MGLWAVMVLPAKVHLRRRYGSALPSRVKFVWFHSVG